jgi:hypothetical protein
MLYRSFVPNTSQDTEYIVFAKLQAQHRKMSLNFLLIIKIKNLYKKLCFTHTYVQINIYKDIF